MALSLVLDAAIPQLSEPGFWRFVSTREVFERGEAADTASQQGLWTDEPTKTLMLRPLQLDPTWLNTRQQADSIIRLSEMTVNAADTAAFAIFEQPYANADNPFIYHNPVGPASLFPAAVMPEGIVPGAAPSLVGITPTADATATDSLVRVPNDLWQSANTLYAKDSAPPLVQVGSTADGKFLVQSKDRLAANQALFFRWFHPQSQLGFPVTYEFYVGQYRLRIKDVAVEVFKDTSQAGDRKSWKKVATALLFSVNDFSPTGTGNVFTMATPSELLAHDRSLLFLPYRRHQILLLASTGKWAVITVRPIPKRLADDSDWDITREDTVLVWVQTPASGRFQIQKVKYPSGTITVKTPTTVIDYTPSVAPTITLTKDSDHGSTLTSTRSQPPSYTLPVNDADDCPPAQTTANDQRREYGVTLAFTASSDKRWTPFFYGYQITADRAFISSLATPTTVADSGTGKRLVSATLTAGLGPGEGRMTAEVIDPDPYDLSTYYYRSSYPIQVKDGATTVFTGVTEPTELTPIKGHATAPRRLTIPALDRWKHLSDTYLRDQRDWTTFGHIDVVKFVTEQAGVDCTSAEFPAGYTPGTINAVNSALGGTELTTSQAAKDIKPGWQPKDDDTAASYVKRVAEIYSGWYVGFRLDGTFFYLPRTYFTTPTVPFAAAHSGSSPYIYGNPTFTTVEPEANVILVKAGDTKDGGIRYSSLWVDWASIRNPLVVNYLGRWRAEVVQVGGAFSCAQLNWIARTIWDQTRRRRITVSFEADFVPSLGIGHVCTLGSYGDYRITGFSVDLTKATHHRAKYEGELVEKGHGLGALPS